MKIIILLLSISTVFFGSMAYKNKTVYCDELVTYPDGAMVCEIFIRPSANSKHIIENGITEAQRI